ncbi:MAG: putative glycolipid-binding domain-containing protein [Propionibacteriaceae bacterium]
MVMLHGGPGLPDYLGPVAAMIEDLTVVHRYDQRGVGGSPWSGEHTVDLHLQDLEDLLDGWGYDQVTLVGHSYGTDLAVRFCLRCPDRVAGLVLLAGPFVGDWREADHATRTARMTAAQVLRLAELEALEDRTEAQEQELLTLSWFPDHDDQDRAWQWAAEAARTRRPVNWEMNRQLSRDRKAAPLEECLDELAQVVPPATVLMGGAGDPRPAAALVQLGHRLQRRTVIIPKAGHEPWLEDPDRFRDEIRRAVVSHGVFDEPDGVSASWIHHDARQGFESATVLAYGDGHRLLGHTTAVEDGVGWTVGYRIDVDQEWRTIQAEVTEVVAGRENRVVVESDRAGHWTVDGRPAPEVDGCLDLDLESSALTNTIFLHRVQPTTAATQDAPAAFLRCAPLRLERIDQTYRRVRQSDPPQQIAYQYASPAYDTYVELHFDHLGLVVDYPGLATRHT